jgi:hypothetical protein
VITAEAQGKQNSLGYYLTAREAAIDGLTTHMGLRITLMQNDV